MIPFGIRRLTRAAADAWIAAEEPITGGTSIPSTVADGRAHWVKVLDLEGKPIGRFGEKGKGAGQFNVPHHLCVDSKGAVYVAEVDNKRVQKFVAKEK